MVVRLLLLLPGSKTTRGFRDGSGRKRDGLRDKGLEFGEVLRGGFMLQVL
jgi:hypothetical protein